MEVVYAIHNFEGESPDEIPFKVGQPIKVIEKDEPYNDGWWMGENVLGHRGLFPKTYTTYRKPPSADDMSKSSNGILAPEETSIPVIAHETERLATMQDTMSHIEAAINSLKPPVKHDRLSAVISLDDRPKTGDSSILSRSSISLGEHDDDISMAELEDVIAGKGLVPRNSVGGRFTSSLEKELNHFDLISRTRKPTDNRSFCSRSEYSVETEFTKAGEDDSPNGVTSDMPISHNASAIVTKYDITTGSIDQDGKAFHDRFTTADVQEHEPNNEINSETVNGVLSSSNNDLPEDPRLWNVQQVAGYLRSEGFESIVANFQDNEITGDVLLELDLVSLKEIDIKSFGKRFHVMNAITALKKRVSQQRQSRISKDGTIERSSLNSTNTSDLSQRNSHLHQRTMSAISTKSSSLVSPRTFTPNSLNSLPGSSTSASSNYVIGPGGEMLLLSPESQSMDSPVGSDTYANISEISAFESRFHQRSISDGPEALRSQKLHSPGIVSNELELQKDQALRKHARLMSQPALLRGDNQYDSGMARVEDFLQRRNTDAVNIRELTYGRGHEEYSKNIVEQNRTSTSSSNSIAALENASKGSEVTSNPILAGPTRRSGSRSSNSPSEVTGSPNSINGNVRSSVIAEESEHDFQGIPQEYPEILSHTPRMIAPEQESYRAPRARAMTDANRLQDIDALDSNARLSIFEDHDISDDEMGERNVMSDGETPQSLEAKSNRRRKKFLRSLLGGSDHDNKSPKKKEKKEKRVSEELNSRNEQEKKDTNVTSSKSISTSPASDIHRFGSLRKIFPGGSKRDSRKLDKSLISGPTGMPKGVREEEEKLVEELGKIDGVLQRKPSGSPSKQRMVNGISSPTSLSNGFHTSSGSLRGVPKSPPKEISARGSMNSLNSASPRAETADILIGEYQNGSGTTIGLSTGSSNARSVATSVVTPSMRGGALAQIGEPNHEGWLRKRGEKYNIWKTRYVLLKGMHLYYLRSEKETKIKGFIALGGYKIIADDQGSSAKMSNVIGSNGGKYGFKIIHDTERPHYFATDDPAIAREWIKAMMKATIGRDLNMPVISSCNIPTVPLAVAQRAKPRPPSLFGPSSIIMSTLDGDKSIGTIPGSLGGVGVNAVVITTGLKGKFTGVLKMWTPTQYVEWLRIHVGDEDLNLDKFSLPFGSGDENLNSFSMIKQSSIGELDDSTVLQLLTGPLMRNGIILIRLVESLSGQNIGRNIPEATYTLQMLENLIQGFKFLSKVGVSTEGVTVKDVYNGDYDRIIELLDHIRQRFPHMSGGELEEV